MSTHCNTEHIIQLVGFDNTPIFLQSLSLSAKILEIPPVPLFANNPLKRTIILDTLICFKNTLFKDVLIFTNSTANPIDPC